MTKILNSQVPTLPPYGRALIENPELLLKALNILSAAIAGKSYTDIDMAGSLALPEATTLTITSGTIDISTGTGQNVSHYSAVNVDTEAAAATDYLDTITGGRSGQLLFLRAFNAARIATLRDGVGNITLDENIDLDVTSFVVLIYISSAWVTLSGLAAASLVWEPLTNGDAATPELIYAAGDVVMTPA